MEGKSFSTNLGKIKKRRKKKGKYESGKGLTGVGGGDLSLLERAQMA